MKYINQEVPLYSLVTFHNIVLRQSNDLIYLVVTHLIAVSWEVQLGTIISWDSNGDKISLLRTFKFQRMNIMQCMLFCGVNPGGWYTHGKSNSVLVSCVDDVGNLLEGEDVKIIKKRAHTSL